MRNTNCNRKRKNRGTIKASIKKKKKERKRKNTSQNGRSLLAFGWTDSGQSFRSNFLKKTDLGMENIHSSGLWDYEMHYMT